MNRRNFIATLIAVLMLGGASRASAADGELIGTSVTFATLPGGTWTVIGDYEVVQWTGSEWSYSWTIEQWRGGSFLAVVDTGETTVGAGETTWCSTFCNGTCYVGSFQGQCHGTNLRVDATSGRRRSP